MKDGDSIFAGRQGVQHQLSLGLRLIGAGLALAVIVAGLSGPAYCRTNGVALLLQQTPAKGGTISPAVGVHYFDLNTEITLTAVPKPGYQFVYWLGDVSDPTSNSTIAYIDAAKIIIAVFELSEYEFLAAVEERAKSIPTGGLRRSAADYARGGGGGAGKPYKWSRPSPPEAEEQPPEQPPEPEEEDDFPVPEQGDDFPVPAVPEPATVVLLILGSLLAVRRRAKR